MDFVAFRSFWETAVNINIASFMATPVLQHGYGMNAVGDNPSAASLTDTVSNFGAAYVVMQESLRNSNTSINAMQGQIQMLCNALGNQPPAGMLQYPQQTNQGHQARSGQHGQQQNNGNGSGYYQGSGMTFDSSGGSYPTQGISNPPSPIKKFNNWNYCHTHGGDVHNNHTSATCAQPGVNNQNAATRSNTMGGNNKGSYIKPYSQLPLANSPRLLNQPRHPPTTPHLFGAIWQQWTAISY
jgi:hypothetical protein